MQSLDFSYGDALVDDDELQELGGRLQPEIERMNDVVGTGYEDERGSINLPDDQAYIDEITQLVGEKKQLDPDYLVTVGIGGSNLGTVAVQEAVLGRLFNEQEPDTEVLYAETVDPDSIQQVLDIIEPALQRGDEVLVNGVSKSGSTTETVANFEVVVDLLQEYREDYEDYVIATTGEGSPFHELAEEEGFDTLTIPDKVGGRFSVFSAVGLFPLGMLGVDIDELLDGARTMRDRCLEENITDNPAARSAATIYAKKQEGYETSNLFLFSKDFESVGKWYRQLTAENLGKEYDREGNEVNEGILPIVSIGSTDLHSMAQLFLGGPDDIFHTFVGVDEYASDVELPEFERYEELVANIQGREMDEIMKAIYEGTKQAFHEDERPFMEAVLPDTSEASIGQFLQWKMMESMYLGSLLNVNPFNQPQVESYKQATRDILKD
jgi:glucose-6-phosphate isomerase